MNVLIPSILRPDHEASSSTLTSVQALRGIALAIVVLIHAHHVELKYTQSDFFLLGEWTDVAHAGVDIFFLVSGFILVWLAYGKTGSTEFGLSFVYRRVTRVYPPYWIFSLALLPVYVFAPVLVNSSEANQVDLLRSFLLWPAENLPLIPVAWTLYFEMYWYIGFGLLTMLAPRLLVPSLVVWFLVDLVLIYFRFQLPASELSPEFEVISSPMMVEFKFGALAALLLKNKIYFRPGLLLLMGVVGFLGGFLGHKVVTGEFLMPHNWRPIAYGVPLGLVLYGSVALEITRRYRAPRFLVLLGDWSYSIYLSHVMVLSVIGRAWYELAIPGAFATAIWFVGSIVGVVLFGYLSVRYMETPLLNCTRRLETRVLPRRLAVAREAASGP